MDSQDTNAVSAEPETGSALTDQYTDPGENVPMDKLTAFFEGEGSPEVQDQDSPEEEPESEQDPEAEQEPAEQADEKESGEEEEEEQQEEETEDEGEKPEAGADFNSLSQPVEFLDAKAIKAKYPRNSSNELIAEAARAYELAKQGHEALTSIGGEHFLPVAQKFVEGVKTGNTKQIFEGVIEGASTEGLLHLAGDTADLVFNRGDEFQKNDDQSLVNFGKAVNAVRDSVIESRFGEGVTMDVLQKLVDLHHAGWLEAIDKWGEEQWVDPDEAETLLKESRNPEVIEARKQAAALKQQLQEKEAQAQSAVRQQEAEADSQFATQITDDIGKVLDSVVWAHSAVNDQDSDSPELKAQKAMMRDYLKHKAVEAFNASEARNTLSTAFRQGKQNTASFRQAKTEAIHDAILKTRDVTAVAESTLASIIGGKRNTKLAKTATTRRTPQGEAPTVPDRSAERREGAKTRDEIEESLISTFSAGV